MQSEFFQSKSRFSLPECKTQDLMIINNKIKQCLPVIEASWACYYPFNAPEKHLSSILLFFSENINNYKTDQLFPGLGPRNKIIAFLKAKQAILQQELQTRSQVGNMRNYL